MHPTGFAPPGLIVIPAEAGIQVVGSEQAGSHPCFDIFLFQMVIYKVSWFAYLDTLIT